MEKWQIAGIGMKSMGVRLLLNTNILVYAYDLAEGDKMEQAIDILDRCAKNQEAAISSQI